MKPVAPGDVPVFVFGDQTDVFYPTIKLLYAQSSASPWLRLFLQTATSTLKDEIQAMEPNLRDTFGGDFTDLLQLAERFRESGDPEGLASTVLVTIMRTGVLVQYLESNPALFCSSTESPTCLVAACGGLLVAAALLFAHDMASLCRAGLDTIRMARRLIEVVTSRSRSIQDGPGCWGWLVQGVDATKLQSALDSYHETENTVEHRKMKLAGTGLENAWHTVVGPPAVLEHFFETFPAVQNLAKSKLRVSGLVHVISDVTQAEIDHVAGGMTSALPIMESNPVRANVKLVSLGEGGVLSAPTWSVLLQLLVREILSQPLNMPRGLSAVSSVLPSGAAVKVYGVGPSVHIPTLCAYLGGQGNKVVGVERDPKPPLGEQDAMQSPGRVAIVGMGGRYPRSGDLEEFWQHICQGKALHTEIPKDRFSLDDYYSASSSPFTTNTKYGCFLDNPGLFDARFFSLSPREAMEVDPAHRLFLLAVFEALESAGYSRRPHTKTAACRFATFVGQIADDWAEITRLRGGDAFSLTGIQRSFAAGRVNYHFKWAGPAVTLDTACSSSMTALDQACTFLLSGQCDMAVAGGTNILTSPSNFNILGKAGFTSTTGGSKSYRADADGYCRGEFVGAFVLKRYEDAVAANDNILAVILSSARNHSGDAVSITHSDPEAQQELMAEVLRKARLEPSDVSYVEMHGTGTQVGDYAEMMAVSKALGRRRRPLPLPLGSIKANAGHGEAGAGAAAVIKAIMMFERNIMPPQPGLPGQLNPRFPPLSELNVEIPTETQSFAPVPGRPRRILLNNFDAAGGNTCILLEEPPSRGNVTDVLSESGIGLPSRYVVVTSAKSLKSHEMNKKRLLAYLGSNPTVRIQDLAYTTAARRLHHSIRSAYTAASVEELARLIEADIEAAAAAAAAGGPAPGSPARRTPIVFAFSGQGQLHAAMGASLYRDSAAFRKKMKTCVRICESLGFPASFVDIITDPSVDVTERTASETQLAIVCLEVCLAAFWTSCGIVPDFVIGHSLGEFAALHLAGVLSLTDTLFLVGKRSQLMERRCRAGAFSMLSIKASSSSAVISQLLEEYPSTSVSCINGPTATVLSGPSEDISSLQAALRTQHNIWSTTLPLPYAFHSAQMVPVLDEYATLARSVPFGTPKIPFASTLLGEVISQGNRIDAAYLVRQTREVVDFQGGVQAIQSRLEGGGGGLWLELGPAAVLTDLTASILSSSPSSRTGGARMVCSLKPGGSPWDSISAALAAAYETQQDVDWVGFYAPYASQLSLVRLPSYAFDLKDYWRPYPSPAPAPAPAPAAASPPVLEAPPPLLSTCLHHVISTSAKLFEFRSSLFEPHLKSLIDGHRLMDVPISPACVLGEMALTAASYALGRAGHETCEAIELGTRNCVFLRPVSVDSSRTGLTVTITAEIRNRPEGTAVEIKMLVDQQDGSSLPAAQVEVHMTSPQRLAADWAMVSRFIWERCASVVDAAKAGSGQRLTPSFFYSIFAQTVSYSAAFQRVVDVFLSPDMQEGVANVVLAPAPESCSFTLNPYWLDSLTHLAGFLVNGDPSKPADVLYMMNSYDSYNIVEPLESGRPYTVYTRVVKRDKKSAVVNVYVFCDQRLVMQNLGLHLQQIPKSLIARMIGKTEGPDSKPAAPGAAPALLRSAAAGNTKRDHSLAVTSQTGPIPARPAVVARPFQPQPRKPEATPGRPPIADALLAAIAEETGCEVSDLTSSTRLQDLGVDSIMAVQIAESLRSKLGIEIGASVFHEHSSVGELLRALAGVGSEAVDSEKPHQPSATTRANALAGGSDALSNDADVGTSPSAGGGGRFGLLGVLLSTIAAETGAEVSDIEDDFTALADLGVDSIMAMQIAANVRDQTGIDIHPSTLVENPTIGDLRRTFGQHHEQQQPQVAESGSEAAAALSSEASSINASITAGYSFVEHAGTPSTTDTSEVVVVNPTIDSLSHQAPQTPVAPSTPAATPLKVNVVLMQGRKASGHTPLFMFPDGAGSASTYMYLKCFRNGRPLYVLESPYLNNPRDFTVGVEEVSALFKQAVLDTYPAGNFLLAGYSGGAVYAYETARQLIADGHTVSGLLLFDMAVPCLRPDPGMPPSMSLLLPAAMVQSRNWADPTIMRNQQAHMAQMVRTVAEYDPVPMPPGKRPLRTWVTWCKRGVIERLDEAARRQLRQSGILTDAIPNFMEDSAVGPFAWAIPAGKPLGPNGWDRLVGPVRCTSIDADHFTMIIPPDVGGLFRVDSQT
ncbi:beta-ketoacyl synthase domain-containing protein [Colletotrichum graminicola M1.001]|uniref:Beta-ketoacyl synthase domain-containing protein n=1 Tax=Colletotrichum graminicola (strain M1.001 / M2 / FGSC 10212) TaxID=645133 RepID=E3R0J5_COLGM|nr:beta-ketoacyl synthase domain-containing protein [Colletotrichum graminicola M1.001]EFQ36633.1 beta-ketoacyl synthase domain-containing protein [Colletotrichum graminicola M1.001]